MRKLSKLSLALIIPGIMISSCQKTELDPDLGTSSKNETGVIPKLKGTNNSVLLTGIKQYAVENFTERGANFIPPFVTSDGFGIAKDVVIDYSQPFPIFISGELVFFSTTLDANDFYRHNPNGTVSIHITSNTARAELGNLTTGEYFYSGLNSNMSMNYTGALVEYIFQDPDGDPVTFNFVDMNQNPNAAVWTGVGKVQKDGIGPKRLLRSNLVANPGWTLVNSDFSMK